MTNFNDTFWEKFQGYEPKAEEPPIEAGFLSTEYAERFGISRYKALKEIKEHVENGLLIPVKIKRLTMHGDLVSRAGYKLVNND